jgi:hypothetical protein
MATGSPDTRQRRYVFRGFDESMERLLGADMRLIYGMGVPILMIVGLIVLLALQPASWLVGAIMFVELGALTVIVRALYELMSDDEDEDGEATTTSR